MNKPNDLRKQHSAVQIQRQQQRKSSMKEAEVSTPSKVSNLSLSPRLYHRRSFLRSVGVGAMALAPAAALLSGVRKASAQSNPGTLTQRDPAILRFLPAT